MSNNERAEEFVQDGKTFLFMDFSNIDSNEEFKKISSGFEKLITQYPADSLYTITNLDKVKYDSESIKMTRNFIKITDKYVKYAAIINIDGAKKFILNKMFSIKGRKKIIFTFSKEKAVNLLLDKE